MTFNFYDSCPYTPIPDEIPPSIGPSIDGFSGGACSIGLTVLNDADGAIAAVVVMLLYARVSAPYWSRSTPNC